MAIEYKNYNKMEQLARTNRATYRKHEHGMKIRLSYDLSQGSLNAFDMPSELFFSTFSKFIFATHTFDFESVAHFCFITAELKIVSTFSLCIVIYP
jgi:hypothetical protein